MASNASLQHTGTSVDGVITPEMRRAIELELDAICGDAQFRTSQRNCDFLRYVVRETLAGRADGIKERTLGRELFGRPISYDTGSDAVVRVRANEVRKRLICYYENHASQAGWRLQLPLRTYVPAFLPDEASMPPKISLAPVSAPHEDIRSIEPPPADEKILSLSQMVVPALVALFLCAAAFRCQAFSGTPYIDFWGTLLSRHSGIAFILDADPADPHAVTIQDLQLVRPLLRMAEGFHAATIVRNSADAGTDRGNLLYVHITHYAPKDEDPQAAYVTMVPGRKTRLWVSGTNRSVLSQAIGAISSAGSFPIALEIAIRRKSPTRLRFMDGEPVTAQTLPPGAVSWRNQAAAGYR